MVVDKKAFTNFISILMSDVEVRKTVRHSVEGAIVCGTLSFVGGMLAGPVGLALGSAFGGGIAYAMKSDKFLPIGDVLNKLTDSQLETLVQEIISIVDQLDVEDLARLPSELDSATKTQVINAVTNFIANELEMEISK